MKPTKNRIALTISMPPDMAEEYDNLARKLAKNRSVLFREMFLSFKKQHLKAEFRELQRYGAERAQQKGVFTESDVEKLVFQGR
jgi:metal-responsive CopG/Arc/MetJ family transcriptional regulator